MTDQLKSKLWVFLNSNFGLFMMSSIVLSFITWSYTQWTDSLQKEKAMTEKRTKLMTEISYRVQVMENYFESECSDHKNLSRKTFTDIDDIYGAAPSYKAIFPENAGKDFHTLIWEMSTIKGKTAKPQYISCFDSLLIFNAYLNRLQNQIDKQGLFYGQDVVFAHEVAILQGKFKSALSEIESEQLFSTGQPSKTKTGDWGTNQDPRRQRSETTPGQRAEDLVPFHPDTLRYSIQELWDASERRIPFPDGDSTQPFLMAVEDVFSITGRGTVATGRIERGKIRVGDEVDLVGLGARRKTVVTGVEMFRKLMDQASAGDNVGLVLSDMDKDEVERGMVLAFPGSITPHTFFDAEVYVLTKDEGGRFTPFFNGYRPQFYFRTTDVTGSVQLPSGVDKVMPGDFIAIRVKLISEIALEESLRFAVREGGRTVGAGIVTNIIDDDFGNKDIARNENSVKWEVVGLRLGNKIAAIKAIRSVTGLGLKEAKELAEGMPVTIVTGIALDQANRVVKELNDAGVKTELRKLEK